MTFHLSHGEREHQRIAKTATLCVAVIAGCFTLIAGQRNLRDSEKTANSCSGLHAGVRAEVVRRDPNFSRPAFVMVSFVLLNDGDSPVNSTKGGWTIEIDGMDLKDSDYILGNGMQPDGGWGILNPGESYEFGKELEISKYFPKLGEHTLSWKGGGFQSSTITVKITLQ